MEKEEPFTLSAEDLDEDKLMLIFEEAKTRLQATHDAYDSLFKKATFILGIIGTTSIGLIAYFFKEKIEEGQWMYLFPLLVYLVIISISIWHLYHIVTAVELDTVGYNPNKWVVPLQMKKPKVIFLQSLLKKYSEKIEGNSNIMKEMGRHLREGIYFYLISLAALIPLLIIAAMITRSLSSSYHPQHHHHHIEQRASRSWSEDHRSEHHRFRQRKY